MVKKHSKNDQPENRPERSASIKAGQEHQEQSLSVDHDLIVVGIGASAGGLDALQKMMSGIRPKSNMAYVVLQHLSAERTSALPELLGKHTTLPVETIANGMKVKADTVYITPPGTNVTFSKGCLILVNEPDASPKPSIDTFFVSLAEKKETRAVGIILSGTGSDGARGIRAIKSHGGITMAQSAASARFDGMPKAAIETGEVDLVLPPENLAEGLERVQKYPSLLLRLPVDPHLDAIGTILEMAYRRTGINFTEYKRSTIRRRISRRMAIHQLDTLADYIDQVKINPQELDAFSKDMLIAVTEFFRDRQAFDALSRHVSKLFEKKPRGDVFRAWVPGCATGEEVYSIAILIAEILGENWHKFKIQIFATDIDEESIQTARKATYPNSAMMNIDRHLVDRYFTSREPHYMTLKKQIRDVAIFARQDLITDIGFMRLDLVSCRNVMIYMNAELQEKVLATLHYSLNHGGILFLGKSESASKRENLFQPLDPGWKIFSAKNVPIKIPLNVQSQPVKAEGLQPDLLPSKEKTDCVLQESAFLDALLKMMPCAAVITDAHANIRYIRGDVSPYFRLPTGPIKENLNAVEMARPELRLSLQSMIHQANKSEKPTVSNTIALDGEPRGVWLKVGPAKNEHMPGAQLIIFTPAEPPPCAKKPNTSSQDLDSNRIRQLEQELALTREHLQEVIEKLETSTEELQSLNEEMQAANEEMQATNEELETSNEELSASNEELHTVNDELRAKSDEASELLKSLGNSEKRYRRLVDNMNEALMLCKIEYSPDNRPTDLVIQQANHALEDLLSIRLHDLPLRVGAIKLEELIAPDMLEKLNKIVKGAKPQPYELNLKSLKKILTLSAYRMGGDRLGIVCRDDTERTRIAGQLRASEKKNRELLETANSIIIRWDNQGIIRFINDYGLKFFGYGIEELINRDVMTLVPKIEESSGRDLDALVKDILVHPENYSYVPSENITKDGDTVWVAWTNKAIRDEKGNIQEILAIGNDITTLKNTEAALHKSETFLSKVLNSSVSGLYIYDIELGANVFISRQYKALTGYSLEDINAMAAADFEALFHPDDAPRVKEHMQKVIQSRDDDVFEIEYRFKKHSGEWVWFLSYDTVFSRNEDGSVRQLVGTFVDTTERKKMEDEIKESLQEKEVMLKEIHHRVKNNMQVISSLVSIQANVLQDKVVREAFEDISQRVRSMALVHEQLYQTAKLSSLDFAGYARSLLDYIWRGTANENSNIILKTDFEPLELSVDSAVPFGLILNELVSNALKHAFEGLKKGEVRVEIKKYKESGVQLSVCDNGKGFPPELNWENAKTLGLTLVRILSQQVNAEFSMNHCNGTQCVIVCQKIQK